MLYKLERNGKATEFYWRLGAGPLRQLGDFGEAAEMAYAVIDHFSGKRTDPIPDLPELPADAPAPFTVPEAVCATGKSLSAHMATLYPPAVSGQIYRHQHRVSYALCTVGNHVYHSRFLDILEIARCEFLLNLG